MAHVSIVRLEMMVLSSMTHFRSRHRRRGILMGSWNSRSTPIVRRGHLQSISTEMMMPSIHKRVNHR